MKYFPKPARYFHFLMILKYLPSSKGFSSRLALFFNIQSLFHNVHIEFLAFFLKSRSLGWFLSLVTSASLSFHGFKFCFLHFLHQVLVVLDFLHFFFFSIVNDFQCQLLNFRPKMFLKVCQYIIYFFIKSKIKLMCILDFILFFEAGPTKKKKIQKNGYFSTPFSCTNFIIPFLKRMKNGQNWPFFSLCTTFTLQFYVHDYFHYFIYFYYGWYGLMSPSQSKIVCGTGCVFWGLLIKFMGFCNQSQISFRKHYERTGRLQIHLITWRIQILSDNKELEMLTQWCLDGLTRNMEHFLAEQPTGNRVHLRGLRYVFFSFIFSLRLYSSKKFNDFYPHVWCERKYDLSFLLYSNFFWMISLFSFSPSHLKGENEKWNSKIHIIISCTISLNIISHLQTDSSKVKCNTSPFFGGVITFFFWTFSTLNDCNHEKELKELIPKIPHTTYNADYERMKDKEINHVEEHNNKEETQESILKLNRKLIDIMNLRMHHKLFKERNKNIQKARYVCFFGKMGFTMEFLTLKSVGKKIIIIKFVSTKKINEKTKPNFRNLTCDNLCTANWFSNPPGPVLNLMAKPYFNLIKILLCIKYNKSTIRNQSIIKKISFHIMGPKRLLVKNKHVLKREDFMKPINYVMVDLVIFDPPNTDTQNKLQKDLKNCL
ncbi:hypothetical protein VP01_615g1 [Puccinia sorghi]|uniref:Uncharacterized protein n=1 Tax=Puccinia sorghi TaxID=27349 RepID=A0A0L6UIY5_9BASI|nr:hypothetical protein VP01_615g1 [Puccinia sorghi]